MCTFRFAPCHLGDQKIGVLDSELKSASSEKFLFAPVHPSLVARSIPKNPSWTFDIFLLENFYAPREILVVQLPPLFLESVSILSYPCYWSCYWPGRDIGVSLLLLFSNPALLQLGRQKKIIYIVAWSTKQHKSFQCLRLKSLIRCLRLKH